MSFVQDDMGEVNKVLIFTPSLRRIDKRWIENMFSYPDGFQWYFVRDKWVVPEGVPFDVCMPTSFNKALRVLYAFDFTHFVYLHDDVLVKPEVVRELMQYDVSTCVVMEEGGSIAGQSRRSLFKGMRQQDNPTESGIVRDMHTDRFFVAKKKMLPMQLTENIPIEDALVWPEFYFRTDLNILHLFSDERAY